MMTSLLHLLHLLLLSLLFCPASVRADFGDYADLSFECPALTTCPTICVADLSDCPTTCTLEEPHLCPDGSCRASSLDCDLRATNRCESNSCGYPLACPKIVLEYPECNRRYDAFYSKADGCPKSVDEAPKLSWTLPGFVVFYAWISIVTSAVLGWCAFNQRLKPAGDVRPLQASVGGRRKSSYAVLDSVPSSSVTKVARVATESQVTGTGARDSVNIDGWQQTAYRKSFVGQVIYGLVVTTLVGFHVLMAVTCAFYYAQQDGRHTEDDINPFQNDQQILIAFELVWIVGFFWSLAFKWPSSVQAMFLRRCDLKDATMVAVFCPSSSLRSNVVNSRNWAVRFFAAVLEHLMSCANYILGCLFGQSQSAHGTQTFCPVKVDGNTGTRFITYQMRRFNYDEDAECFAPSSFSVGRTLGDFLACRQGLTEAEVNHRHSQVGRNVIHLPKPSYLKSVLQEFSKVFYLYQMFIIWTWLNFNYYPVGLVNLCIFGSGGVIVSYIRWQNEKHLYAISLTEGMVDVFRNGELKAICQSELAPGDAILVKPGIAYCDLVLIHGCNGALVDESALTGEATPVGKSAIDPSNWTDVYRHKEHRKQTISAGTTVIEAGGADNDIIAVVINTGTNTAKGNLLRDIFYRKRAAFKFDVEMQIVLMILVVMAVLNSIIMTRVILGGAPFAYSFFFAGYIIYATIPPLIATVFVASTSLSLERLKKKRIICSNSDAIKMAGKVKHAFFDKTGTLTRQGLEFLQIDCYDKGEPTSEDKGDLMVKAMATCHTLTLSSSGDYVGHYLDKVMFEARTLIKRKDEAPATVLRRHEFDHHRMTQSVILQDEVEGTIAIVKGSPESIKMRCSGESIPDDYDDVVRKRSKAGTYQISVGVRHLERYDQDIARDGFEENLTFLGFIDFKNVLRAETKQVIKDLKDGDVRPSIISGDSVYTGVTIAEECGIIDTKADVVIGQEVDLNGDIIWVDNKTDERTTLPSEYLLAKGDCVLAVNGEVWQHLRSRSNMVHLANYISVFGRCTPNDKVSVVDHSVRSGTITLMCGDGGNDCGALRTAHIGVALSDAEASIVSPFTSLDKSITDVVRVLREGRCCLANSFAAYKFMIVYGQVKVMMNFMIASYTVNFPLWNWILIDGFWLITLGFSLPMSRAARKLTPERPTSSLLGAYTMTSTLGVLAINVLFGAGSLVLLENQDWYQCRKWGSTDISNVRIIGDNYESEVIWLVCGPQIVSAALAYNLGYQFRRAWYRNYLLVGCVTLWMTLHFYIILAPSPFSCAWRVNCNNDEVVRGAFEDSPIAIQNAFNTTEMPEDFRLAILLLIIANFVANTSWEGLLVNTVMRWRARKRKEISREKALEHLQKNEGKTVVTGGEENV